jgi:hypothetical protein
MPVVDPILNARKWPKLTTLRASGENRAMGQSPNSVRDLTVLHGAGSHVLTS